MEITVEEISPLTRKLKIVLPVEEVGKELEAAYNKLKSEVNIKGFRKGKAPKSILKKNYGPQVQAEVGEKLIQSTYFDAVEKEKLDPVVHPEIKSVDFTNDGTFVYEVEIDVRPVFELGTYKGLEIDKPELQVGDAEVEAELERLRKQMAPLRNVDDDHAIQSGDIAIVNFQGYENGEALKQVHGDTISIDVGSGRNGREFEEKLVGMRKGGKENFVVTFAAEAPNPFLAGKTVEFRVEVLDVKERVTPELDDDFARDVGKEFQTLDALKNSIREKMMQRKETAAEGDLSDKIMLKLLANHEFEVPARLVRYEIEEYIKQMEENLQRGGLNLEAAGVSREDLAKRYRDGAEKRVRGDFILKMISEKENIKIVDEDLNRGFERIGQQYNMTVQDVKGYFKSRDDLLPFMNELLNEKILKFLMDEARITTVSGEESGENADKKAESQPASQGDGA